MLTDPHATAQALLALGRALRARQGALLQPHGLHPGQDALLLEVWDDPGLNQSVLAARLGVESPTVTRMVKRLERVGLLERRPDLDDGRRVRIYPTPRSRLLEGSVRRVWEEVGEELVSGIGATDAHALTVAARRAVEALHAPPRGS